MRMVRMLPLITAVLLPACAAKKPAPLPPPPPATREAAGPAAEAAPPQQPPLADAYGSIPETLAGTWLVVTNLKLPVATADSPDVYNNSVKVLRISRDEEHWRVDELTLANANPLSQALSKANQAGSRFVLSDDVREDTAREAGSLAVEPPHVDRIVIYTPGQLPTSRKRARPTEAEDFRFALGFLEKGEHVAVAGTTYEAREVSDKQIAGLVKIASISTPGGPIVVPFVMTGPFTMYRLQ